MASVFRRRGGSGPAPARPVATPGRARGRVWATLGFILGIAVSVAGNVAHASYPTREALATALAAGETWSPPIGSRLIAAFFPIALLVTVEVLARVPWPRTFGMAAAKYGGAALVAGVAGIVSYQHLSSLLQVYGEDELTVWIGPLSVDGLMVVSGFALLAIGQHNALTEVEPAPPALVWGSVSSPRWLAVQPGPGAPGEHASEVPAIEAPADTGKRPTVVTSPSEAVATPGLPPEDVAVVESAREQFAEVLAGGGLPSVRKLRSTYNLGHPRAKRVRAALDTR